MAENSWSDVTFGEIVTMKIADLKASCETLTTLVMSIPGSGLEHNIDSQFSEIKRRMSEIRELKSTAGLLGLRKSLAGK